jgi:hypothetical protein
MKAWVRSFFVVSALLLTTQAWAVDLSGIWRSPWGEMKVTQQGQNVTAIYTDNSPAHSIGDEAFHGVLTGNQLLTKVLSHFPLFMKSVCPASVWTSYSDMSITVSQDGKSLTGQYIDEYREVDTCNVDLIHTATASSTFTKNSESPVVTSSACLPIIINSNLDVVHIPNAVYKDTFGNTMNLWVYLQYLNNTKGWQPANYGVNSANSTCSSATIGTNLNIHIPNAIYKDAAGNTMNLWIDLQYTPINGTHSWKLSNYGVNP